MIFVTGDVFSDLPLSGVSGKIPRKLTIANEHSLFAGPASSLAVAPGSGGRSVFLLAFPGRTSEFGSLFIRGSVRRVSSLREASARQGHAAYKESPGNRHGLWTR